MSICTTELNKACGMLDRAADLLKGGRLSPEQRKQVEIALRKLLVITYAGERA